MAIRGFGSILIHPCTIINVHAPNNSACDFQRGKFHWLALAKFFFQTSELKSRCILHLYTNQQVQMFTRTGSRCLKQQSIGRRFSHHEAAHHAQASSTEVNIPKALAGFVLAGVGLYFYRSTQDKPIVQTPLYNQSDDRPTLRNETYLNRYKTSFIKGFIKDRGGIGQRHFKRKNIGATPTILIPTHSPTGDQFGAGIKLSELGPRKEPTKYFAPLPKSE